MDDIFGEFDNGENLTQESSAGGTSSNDNGTTSMGEPSSNDNSVRNTAHGSKNGSYAEEIFSRKIEARSRTYFIDLKQSQYGKFLKISERSRGRKTTIMIDAENVEELIEALGEAQSHL
jgi:hypothetical protein